jgi:catechol 2,3-dioxygenase-like lactoylglutathione lyase family enzyme
MTNPLHEPCSLGAFSASLAVRDLAASTAFYEKLGFTVTGGDGTSWSILVNGPAVIGLFQGMFEKNILTFNPGWDPTGRPIEDFKDVRQLAAELAGAGLELQDDTTADSESGPASFVVTDPDGNPVLIDQHI